MTAATNPGNGVAADFNGEPVVRIRNLSHFFGQGTNKKQVLFDNNIDIDAGELIIMTGPSGSGKTTLLTLIGALRSTQQGSIRVLGRELLGLKTSELVAVRRSIGFIFQLHNLFDSLSAYENVRMSMELHGYSSREIKRKAHEMLTALGLGERINYKPKALSGGQRQRVAITRALVNRPKLILADEPTAALDKQSSRDVVDLLKRLTREDRATILMVTHDSRILDVADRIVNMVDGHIESDVRVGESVRICEFLKKSELFTNLSPTELLNVAEKMTRENFSSGETIIRQGDRGDKFYIIGSGIVDVYITPDDDDGKTKVVDQMGEADFFGEKALITGDPRNASIVATDNVVTYSLGKADFERALKVSDSFEEQLLKVAFQR